MSAQTLVCQTARSGPLGHDIFLGPGGALPLVVATRRQATRLRNSVRLLLAGPLGPAAFTDDRHRQARTLVRWTTWWCSCCVARCPLLSSSRHSPQDLVCLAELSRSHLSDPFRHWVYQSESERVSPLSPRRTSGQTQPRTSGVFLETSVQPRRKGYLPKASSRVGAQTSLDVKTSTLVLPTARSVALWPEHVSCQTAPTPTLSQFVPALIHPHVTLDPYPAWSRKPQTVRAVSARSQSLTCAITLKARSGYEDTLANVPAASLPQELE